jgi:transposase-like protein
MSISPLLATGDGALGFWSALEEEFPETKHQRCWVHKTVNILDKMAKSVQGNAKELILIFNFFSINLNG